MLHFSKGGLQVDVYTPLKAVLEHAWQLWEAQILAQPLLIIAPTASAPLLVQRPAAWLTAALLSAHSPTQEHRARLQLHPAASPAVGLHHRVAAVKMGKCMPADAVTLVCR